MATELGVQAEDRALTWIAKEATGSLRDAQTLFDQVVSFSGGSLTLEKIKEKLGVLGIDELNEFVLLLRSGDQGKILERMDHIIATGVSLEQFTTDLAEYFRNLLFIKNGITRDTLLGYAVEDFDKTVIDSLGAAQIEKAIEMLLALYRNIRYSLNQRFEFELALVRLSNLDALITAEEIRQAISGIKTGNSRGPCGTGFSFPGRSARAAGRAGSGPGGGAEKAHGKLQAGETLLLLLA